jgi:hypothetical protein
MLKKLELGFTCYGFCGYCIWHGLADAVAEARLDGTGHMERQRM